MGFQKNAIATVWEVSPVSDTMTKARISTSVKRDGKYENDFAEYVTFVGRIAAQKALKLSRMDKIVLDNITVTSRYDKEAGRDYINFRIFNFDKFNYTKKESNDNTYSPQVESNAEEGDDSDSPW